MPAPAEQSLDLRSAADRLYAAAPERFVQVRTELAASARADGDRTLAERVEALRKPTSAAAVVNRQVLADPAVTDRLREIGDRLRCAQGGADGIDRDVLRELSIERRTLVHEVSAQAIESYAPTAGASVRDEVIATFDAAVADPGTAERLGRLLRAEQWSGFGAVAETPPLTIVQGARPSTAPRSGTAEARGGESSASSARSQAPAGPVASARRERDLSAAEAKLSAAEQVLSAALDDEQAAKGRAADLERRITDLQIELGAAENRSRTARAAVRSARSRHREARSTRDRAARRSTPDR